MHANWVVLLGAPGCGKGTQASYLIKSELKFQAICVGDIIRNKYTSMFLPELNTSVGEIINSGGLLPDNVIINIIESELNKINNIQTQNLIFDGFPRTVGQAESLDLLAQKFQTNISHVLNFQIEDNKLIKRILGRYKCNNCGEIYNEYYKKVDKCTKCNCSDFSRRSEDNEEALKVRLREYYNKTHPLIDFYKKSGKLYNIDADREFKIVQEEILEIFNIKTFDMAIFSKENN